MTAADTLAAAGWTHDPATGQWLSPMTRRLFDERAALAIASIKPRTRQPIYRPRTFTRR